ncbi:MAG: hypothetical protein KJO75_04160 [Dactylosporangium sp.]|nr:hypothetical protein [Dactylosporangium sp.]
MSWSTGESGSASSWRILVGMILPIAVGVSGVYLRRGSRRGRSTAWALAGLGFGLGLVGVVGLLGLNATAAPGQLLLDNEGFGDMIPSWHPVLANALNIVGFLTYAAIVVLLATPASKRFARIPQLGDDSATSDPAQAAAATTTGRRRLWHRILAPVPARVAFAVLAVVSVAAVVAVALVHRTEPTDLQRLHGYDLSADAVAYSPDGTTLAVVVIARYIVAPGHGMVRRWDPATGRPRSQPLTDHTNYASTVAFSPDGNILAVGDRTGAVHLWGRATDQRIDTIRTGNDGGVRSVAFSPDGAMLASGGDDGTVQLWNPVTKQPLGRPVSVSYGASGMAFSPDGRVLAIASCGSVYLWDVPDRMR